MQTQQIRSRTNNRVKLGRMCRQYPAIGSFYSQAWRTVASSNFSEKPEPAKQRQAGFTIEWQYQDGSFAAWDSRLSVPVARKLAPVAESLAKQNPGRRVRVIRPGSTRAVLCYRFDAQGNALSY